MKIGITDVDSHNFPNFALMRAAGYHRAKGDTVEISQRDLFRNFYDIAYKSKVFTFTEDIPDAAISAAQLIKGGTGYSITTKLPDEIEASLEMDYSIYPGAEFSLQYFSRGCIRKCPFCLVREKEGLIKSVDPVALNPQGKWLEILDNNFFANPEWREAAKIIKKIGQPVNMHGIDVRLIDEEQATFLNSIQHIKQLKVAWDDQDPRTLEKIKDLTKTIKPYKIKCYVLIGCGSDPREDLEKIYKLRELKVTPFVMVFRDYNNQREPTQLEMDIARYSNRPQLLKSFNFEEYQPRKGVTGKMMLEKFAPIK